MEKTIDFRNFIGTSPGWGHKPRRVVFEAACKYLGISPTDAGNIFAVGFHSVLQSGAVQISGSLLDKVKRDPAIVLQQESLVIEIKNSANYKLKREIKGIKYFGTQLGGQRAVGAMWKQALGFWRWPTTYRATWVMAFDELTWAVRSVTIECRYVVEANGKITFNYSFSDTLDLRPNWVYRSMEYNAICVVMGFLYHDVVGGNDKLKIKANWKTEVSN